MKDQIIISYRASKNGLYSATMGVLNNQICVKGIRNNPQTGSSRIDAEWEEIAEVPKELQDRYDEHLKRRPLKKDKKLLAFEKAMWKEIKKLDEWFDWLDD